MDERERLRRAFQAGWNASSEGFNAECACAKGGDEEIDRRLKDTFEQWLGLMEVEAPARD